jgi:hypothetical protein
VKATIELTANRRVVARWLEGLYDEFADGPPPAPEEWFAMWVRQLADDELQVATMFGPINVGAVRIGR